MRHLRGKRIIVILTIPALANEQAAIKTSQVKILHPKILLIFYKGATVCEVREDVKAESQESSLSDMSIFQGQERESGGQKRKSPGKELDHWTFFQNRFGISMRKR